MLDIVVLTEGGVSFSELRSMPIPEFEVLSQAATRLSEKIRRLTKTGK